MTLTYFINLPTHLLPIMYCILVCYSYSIAFLYCLQLHIVYNCLFIKLNKNTGTCLIMISVFVHCTWQICFVHLYYSSNTKPGMMITDYNSESSAEGVLLRMLTYLFIMLCYFFSWKAYFYLSSWICD